MRLRLQNAAHRSSRNPPHPESAAQRSPRALSPRGWGPRERAAVGLVGALPRPRPRFAARKPLQRPGCGGCRRGWEGAGQAEQERLRPRSSRIPAGTSEGPSSAFSASHHGERGNVHERRQNEKQSPVPTSPLERWPCGQGHASWSRLGPRGAHLRPALLSYHSGCIPGEKPFDKNTASVIPCKRTPTRPDSIRFLASV